MSDATENLVLTILRDLQEGQAEIRTDVSTIKENIGAMNMRLSAVESHMSGFMSSTRYIEGEVDMLRGRVEALEEAITPRGDQ